jgi:hypothetical protein
VYVCADLSVIHQKVYAITEEDFVILHYYELYNLHVASTYERTVYFRRVRWAEHFRLWLENVDGEDKPGELDVYCRIIWKIISYK